MAGQANQALIQQLVEGARGEPPLKGMWSSATFGGSQGLRDLVAGANKRYGTNIQAQFTPGRDMQAVMELLVQEQAAGQPASTDVYLGNAPGILDGMRVGALRSVDWAALLDRPIPADPPFDAVAPDGAAIAFATIIVGILYNTNLVRGADVPRSMEDVFKPQWKGKIASTAHAAGLREFAMPDILGREYMLDYTRRLSQQVGGLIRCGEGDRISSGEFAMLVFSCGGQNAVTGQRVGAPIGHTVVREASVLHMMYGGVPKNSSAPNSAALLIAFLHTPEAQQLLWQLDGMDYYGYPESNTKKEADEVRAAGGKLAYNSPQWLLSSPGFTEVQQELQRFLLEGR
jgi:iron(III) transport system substrate-binding protein